MVATLTRADEIVTVLRTEILTGQYRAGERLPSERDLAVRFCANRGAIREAIKKLEQLGIAAVMPGGVRVVPVEDATLEVLGHLLDLHAGPELIGQFLDVLGAMVALSARSALVGATDEDIGRMQLITGQLIKASDPDKGNKDERQEESHRGWLALSECFMQINRNLVLRLVGNGLRTQFVSRLMSLELHPNIDRKADRRELKKLYAAIRNRDLDQAGEAIIEHFHIIKTGILKAIVVDPAAAESVGHG